MNDHAAPVSVSINTPAPVNTTAPVPQEATLDVSKLTIAISSRALFDMDEGHQIYLNQGVDAYCCYQIEHENEMLEPGVAFHLVQKLLALNNKSSKVAVEVILLSRNSADTGLRIFNSIEHYALQIRKAVFTNGQPTSPYVAPFKTDLFLTADPDDVSRALAGQIAAATVLPSRAGRWKADEEQVRIAFDGDAVLFSDEAERIFQEKGLDEFNQHEKEACQSPLPFGPFSKFLFALQKLQAEFPTEKTPIRTALVTARGSPAHARVIHTLRKWNIRIDESMFLNGLEKGPFLEAFKADIFFDDNPNNCRSAAGHVATGHVPHGISNLPRP